MTYPAYAQADLPLTRRSVDLILVALAAALLPHLLHLPPALALFCLIFGLWRWMASHYAWPLPGAASRTALTVLSLAGVYIIFGTVFGRDAGTALLAIMLGLKLLEVRRFRDAVVVLFLGYFLAITMVLYSQSIPTVLYMAPTVALVTAALIDLNHRQREHPPLATVLRRAGSLLVQALPVMLIMFVLFPRIPGPLWGLPKDAYGGTTGLDDSMTPGSISQLSQSDEVAFRVAFEDAPPPARLLYWRGPVFWYTDGRSWMPNRQDVPPPSAPGPGFVPEGEAVDYTITLEPTNRRWLYALDLPVSAPEGARRTSDLYFMAAEPVRRLTRYTLRSYPSYRTGALTVTDRVRGLQLPGNNPRVRALGQRWRAETGRDPGAGREIVRRALRYFREQPFFYTLQPPLLRGRDPLDRFLLETRRGFCEHYAAAFTLLMRAAGVPARVVTGYQGGELNPLGGYMIVRQRDAHAWSEVWLEGEGWVRFDPTGAVAPSRIERGIDNALERGRDGLFGTLETGPVAELWKRTRLGWDTLNNRWNQWVLGYGPASQSELLSRFGLRNWLDMAVTMVAVTGLILLAVTTALAFGRRTGTDRAGALYQRFCNKLARRGIERTPAEGPVDFAARVGDLRPDLANTVDTISRLYIDARYGGAEVSGQLGRLRREIATFRP